MSEATSGLECAGKAKRRQRLSTAIEHSESGVALRLPPQSK